MPRTVAMHGGVAIGPLLVQFLDAEDIGEGLRALHARILEGIGRLFAERSDPPGRARGKRGP